MSGETSMNGLVGFEECEGAETFIRREKKVGKAD